MSISEAQRRAEPVLELGDGICIEKARVKYDRRQKLLVVKNQDRIVKEFELLDYEAARTFAEGYHAGFVDACPF